MGGEAMPKIFWLGMMMLGTILLRTIDAFLAKA